MAAPAPAEQFQSARLQMQLRDLGVFDSEEGLKCRAAALAHLSSVLNGFCNAVAMRLGYPPHEAARATGKVCVRACV